MNRRKFLEFLGLGLGLGAAPWAYAQNNAPGMAVPGVQASATDTVIVEIINFHCPRCRAVNDYYDTLRQAAEAAGTPLRFAPLSWTNQSVWPDRAYYAVRDLFPAAEPLVRNMLFDAIQTENQLFDDIAQIMSYLDRAQIPQKMKKAGMPFDMLAIADRATSDIPLLSEMKAGHLVALTSATDVPVFAWVSEGQVVDSVSPSDTTDAHALVQTVLKKIATGTKK